MVIVCNVLRIRLGCKRRQLASLIMIYVVHHVLNRTQYVSNMDLLYMFIFYILWEYRHLLLSGHNLYIYIYTAYIMSTVYEFFIQIYFKTSCLLTLWTSPCMGLVHFSPVVHMYYVYKHGIELSFFLSIWSSLMSQNWNQHLYIGAWICINCVEHRSKLPFFFKIHMDL